VPVEPPVRHRPWSADAKRALEQSLRQALAAGDTEIRPEHLLLGILAGRDPVAQALAARGVTAERLRADLGLAS
jgi:ATP-dependent Clp protease ATP-binding subunit ClpA